MTSNRQSTQQTLATPVVDQSFIDLVVRHVVARLNSKSVASSLDDPITDTDITDTDITDTDITDTDDAKRATAVREQLSRRRISLTAARIVLSNSPAQAVYDQIIAGNRAVMIANINDVERFASELSPSVWILDMHRMNLSAAVNAVAKIARIGAPH
jgi:hypothetical protein